MAWKTDMLPVYDQAIHRHNLPALASRIHARIEEAHQTSVEDLAARRSDPVAATPSASELMLEEMLNR